MGHTNEKNQSSTFFLQFVNLQFSECKEKQCSPQCWLGWNGSTKDTKVDCGSGDGGDQKVEECL